MKEWKWLNMGILIFQLRKSRFFSSYFMFQLKKYNVYRIFQQILRLAMVPNRTVYRRSFDSPYLHPT